MEYQQREVLYREAVLAFLGVKTDQPEPDEKRIGWYCKNECVAECAGIFGPILDKVCATCPN